MSTPKVIQPHDMGFSANPEVESWTEVAKAHCVARTVLAALATDTGLPPDTRIAAAVALAEVGS